MKEFRVEVNSPTSVDVSWEPPPRMNWNGRLVSYAITSVRMSPAGSSISKRQIDAHVETIMVTPQANHPDPSLASEPLKIETYRLQDLEENFEYSFSVGIVNSKGLGSSTTDPVMQTMPESGMYKKQCILLSNDNVKFHSQLLLERRKTLPQVR